jgi:DNA-binding transcriptional LysR family regulator
MELRQLEAFVAVATELHFGRAAGKLFMGQPTLSDLIQRLERELGTPLLIRTTRRVTLTEAGTEMLGHARKILDEVAAATASVRSIADGEGGTIRVGMTPPVTPVLARHLGTTFAETAPAIDLVWSQLWLPNLLQAVTDATIDVALTCGLIDERDGLVSEVLCAEPLLVGLRPGHRLAGQERVRLADLARDRMGATPEDLFPAWALVQRQALAAAGVSPPRAPLAATDLAAAGWQDQPELDWILLIGSLAPAHVSTVIRPVDPPQNVPYTLQWNPGRVRSPAVVRFVQHALTTDPPPGWTRVGPPSRAALVDPGGDELGEPPAVGQHSDRGDAALLDGEGHQDERAAAGGDEGAGVAVDQGRVDPGVEAGAEDGLAGDLVRAPGDGRAPVQFDLGCEDGEEPGDVALARCRQEGVDDAAGGSVGVGGGHAEADSSPGPAGEHLGGGGAPAEDGRDGVERQLEHVMQDE